MNISDESFPDDILHITTIDRKSNVSSCISSSSGGNDQNLSASTSGQSFSGTSRETTQSDPIKNPENREDEDYRQKVSSCQDLHSVYTKRRFPHVKSKVREFIESQKAEDELKKSTKDYIRRISTAQTIENNDNQLKYKTQNPNKSDQIQETSSEVAQILVEKEQEMICLKALNEYLQSSLQEKMMEATRLRRNVDSMRIELMHAKDKAKRHSMHSIGMEVRNHYSPRLSLPTLVYKLPRNTTGTQTDFVESAIPETDNNNNSIGPYESNDIATIQPISLNFSSDYMNRWKRQFRRRNTSNPSTPTGGLQTSKLESERSHSALNTELEDPSFDSILRQQFMISENTTNDTTASGQPNVRKRSFTRKWKWIFGPCAKCGDQKNSIGEQYSQTPLLNSVFENRLRAADSNSS